MADVSESGATAIPSERKLLYTKKNQPKKTW
jgi:hypothetical protein